MTDVFGADRHECAALARHAATPSTGSVAARCLPVPKDNGCWGNSADHRRRVTLCATRIGAARGHRLKRQTVPANGASILGSGWGDDMTATYSIQDASLASGAEAAL